MMGKLGRIKNIRGDYRKGLFYMTRNGHGVYYQPEQVMGGWRWNTIANFWKRA